MLVCFGNMSERFGVVGNSGNNVHNTDYGLVV